MAAEVRPAAKELLVGPFSVLATAAVSVLAASVLSACAIGTAPREGKSGGSARPFPLPQCDAAHQDACVALLFPNDEDRVARRDFPARYLELWNPGALRSDPACSGPAADPANCARLQALGRYFASYGKAAPEGARPLLGVALEGGGTKSAPFAMGVLAGLDQADLLKDVGLLSSVSGGSYSAYFYMNRLLDRARFSLPDGPDEWMQSCIPSWWEHLGVFDPLGSQEGAFDYTGLRGGDRSPFCGEVSSNNGCLRWLPGDDAPRPPRTGAPTCLDAAQSDPFKQNFKFRYQVLEYHNLIAPNRGLTLQDERNGFHLYPASRVGQLLVEHAVTLTPIPLRTYVLSMHHLSHTVFDWPMEFSPSGLAYREGIDRAYGFSYDDWIKHEGLGLDAAVDLRRRDDDRRLIHLRKYYEDALAGCGSKTELRCGFPLWIADTTTSSGRALFAWLTTPTRDPLRHQFELSPVGQGSGIHGFANVPPDLALTEVVGASAAFLDEEQRSFLTLKGIPGGVLDAGIHAINANWGLNIDGFNASDLKRGLHNLAPWPLYTAFVGRDAPYIHLDDGGNTDNLALLTQLRRGVRNVVASASTEDATGQFPSLCRIKNQLELDGRYALLMPELEVFGSVCNAQLQASERNTWPAYGSLVCARMAVSAGRRLSPGDDASCPEAARPDLIGRGYDLWAWKVPVLRGCVVRIPAGWTANQIATLETDAAELQCPAAPERDCDTHPEEIGAPCLLSRLYIVKPAIDRPQVLRQLVNAGTSGESPRLCAAGMRIDHCRTGNGLEFRNGSGTGVWRHSGTDSQAPMELSCDALAYLTKPDDCNGDRPRFPQHDVVFTTIQQDYTQYSAYFDLGRVLSKHLRLAEDGRLLELRDCGDYCAAGSARMHPH